VTLIWAGFAAVLAVPIAAAATSPLLAWRDPVYIAAGFAGVVALALMLVQPMLIGGYLPGLFALRGRRVHRWTGIILAAAVVFHVVGLWITSPPDVIDALLFISPTPFSAWGVIAMWMILAVVFLVVFRRRLRLRPRTWRMVHTSLVAVIVVGSVIHAILIQGTMETFSKVALSALVIGVTVKVIADLRVWARRAMPR
jgi:predicted ferric reductase